MNTAIPEFTYIHIHSIIVNEWQIHQSTRFFFIHFLFFFHCSRSRSRTMILDIINWIYKYNKRWTIRIHLHILCLYPNQISMYFYLLILFNFMIYYAGIHSKNAIDTSLFNYFFSFLCYTFFYKKIIDIDTELMACNEHK
jgi:hypothetical protein